MSADTASLAIVHIGLEKSIFALLNASFRTKDIANTAFNTFLIIPNRPLRPPASCMIFTGAARLENNTSRSYFLPGIRPFFLCHDFNTSIFNY
jgi:hypothetical protein